MKLIVVILILLTQFSCTVNDISKGETCLKIGDYEGAEKFFTRSIEDNPGNLNGRLGLAKAYLQKAYSLKKQGIDNPDNWHKAVRQFEFASRIKDTSIIIEDYSQALYLLAKSLTNNGDTLPAIDYLKDALLIAPSNSTILNFAGILNFKKGMDENAIDLFLQASVVDTVDASALFNIGIIHWYRNETIQAHHYLLQALKRKPDDESIIKWFAKADNALRSKKK